MTIVVYFANMRGVRIRIKDEEPLKAKNLKLATLCTQRKSYFHFKKAGMRLFNSKDRVPDARTTMKTLEAAPGVFLQLTSHRY